VGEISSLTPLCHTQTIDQKSQEKNTAFYFKIALRILREFSCAIFGMQLEYR